MKVTILVGASTVKVIWRPKLLDVLQLLGSYMTSLCSPEEDDRKVNMIEELQHLTSMYRTIVKEVSHAQWVATEKLGSFRGQVSVWHQCVTHNQALSTPRATRFAASAQQRCKNSPQAWSEPSTTKHHTTGWSRHQIRQASSNTARSPGIILCDRNIWVHDLIRV